MATCTPRSLSQEDLSRTALAGRSTARNSLGELDDEGAYRYFAVNQLEELDAPGEWYLDHDEGTLYLIPPLDLQDDHLTLSVNPEAVIRGVGTPRDADARCRYPGHGHRSSARACCSGVSVRRSMYALFESQSCSEMVKVAAMHSQGTSGS